MYISELSSICKFIYKKYFVYTKLIQYLGNVHANGDYLIGIFLKITFDI